jgi:hypothetical protein
MNPYFRRWRKQLINAGIEIPDIVSSYRPGGYPRIGLAPLTLKLATRSHAKLEKQLVDSEHARGNTKFTTAGLGHLDIRLANELVSVFLGLSERFRGVSIECINFSKDISTVGSGVYAAHYGFATEFPQLYSVALDMGESDVRGVVNAVYSGEYDRNTLARVERELARNPWNVFKRDALSHGYLELSEHLGHPECSGIMRGYYDACNAHSTRKGRPLWFYPMHASLASSTLIHEYGHAVESAVVQMGPEHHKYVLRALEDCILRKPNGRWKLSDSRVRELGLSRSETRLENWPSIYDAPCDLDGWGARRKFLKENVGYLAAQGVGLYAAKWREECFAESFMQAIASSVPETRQRLAPFLEALYAVGISVKKRRNV